MTKNTFHAENLEQYREIRSLIRSTALKQNKEVLSYQNLRKLIYAFGELHKLLQSTCNPYELYEISETLSICFKLVAGSYQLTQCIKEHLLLEDKMLVHDTLFVGNTIERHPTRKYWIPYENDKIISLFASTGTIHCHKVLAHTYPLLEEPWTAESISTYAGTIPIESDLQRAMKGKKLNIRAHLSSSETAAGQYWSMADAVQANPDVQSIPSHVVLNSVYRDIPLVKQQPSKQRGSGKGLARKGKESNQIARGSTVSLSANRLFCRMVISFNAQSSPGAVLLVGPDGCGKSTLCQTIASIIGVRFLDLNKSIFALEAGEDPIGSQLQDCIQREFQRAATEGPCVVFIRNCERMFISSSNRDQECEKSEIFRAMKRHVVEAVDHLPQNSNVLILGSSSRPDDCVGKDKEDFISFYNADIISMIHPDHYSRMVGIVADMYLKRGNMPHIPWTILSKLAACYPEASWKDIETSIHQTSIEIEHWMDLVREVELNLRRASSSQQGSRISRMIDIESWVQENFPVKD